MKKIFITLALSFLFFFLVIPNTYAFELPEDQLDTDIGNISHDVKNFDFAIFDNTSYKKYGSISPYVNLSGGGATGLDFPLYYVDPDFIGPVNNRYSVYQFSYEDTYYNSDYPKFLKDKKYELIFRIYDKDNILDISDYGNLSSGFWNEKNFSIYETKRDVVSYNSDILEYYDFILYANFIDETDDSKGQYYDLVIDFIPKRDLYNLSFKVGAVPNLDEDNNLTNKENIFQLLKIDKSSSYEGDLNFLRIDTAFAGVKEFTYDSNFPVDDDVENSLNKGSIDLTEGVKSCDGIDVGCWFENLWIVLGNLWKNIGNILVNFLNYLWTIIDMAINLIISPIKQIVIFVLSFWEYLWDGLTDCIVSSFEFLDDYIVTPLVDAISDVLIPDGDYLSTKFQGLFKFIDEKLGFLTFPFEFIANFLDRFLNISNNPVKNITVPSISLGSFGTLIHGFSFNIAEYWEKAPFKQIYDIYLLFIHAFIVFGLYKLCNRKFEEMTGGSNK